MGRYGITFQVADFIDRSISKKSTDPSSVFARHLASFLKKLDDLQESNPSITLTFWAADGVWLQYNGSRLFLLLPRVGSLSVVYAKDLDDECLRLHKALEASGAWNKTGETDYWLWSLDAKYFDVIVAFVESLPIKNAEFLNKSHPRYFPGEVRQLAMELFEKGGRKCPGSRGRPEHRVGKREAVEFDHILPYARGGSRSALNVQVLCEVCNRLKGAGAL